MIVGIFSWNITQAILDHSVCQGMSLTNYFNIQKKIEIFLSYITLENYQEEGKCILCILHHLTCIDVPFIK